MLVSCIVEATAILSPGTGSVTHPVLVASFPASDILRRRRAESKKTICGALEGVGRIVGAPLRESDHDCNGGKIIYRLVPMNQQ
jgi:hypothetical protein